MRTLAVVTLTAAAVLPSAARAADWTPRAWANESTVELRTTAAGDGAHWFPVWLVVLDDHLYVRLGSRAVGRIEGNATKPIVGVRIAGQQFDRVRGEPAPDFAGRVATALGDKYWSDVFVRWVDHPLTLRLVPE